MTLKFYNSLTRKKEVFTPLNEGRVNMYVCGPTVYDHPHIGHAKSYVSFDVIVRYLRYLDYKVRYVQNITDDYVKTHITLGMPNVWVVIDRGAAHIHIDAAFV